jgi:hypothetical protein
VVRPDKAQAMLLVLEEVGRIQSTDVVLPLAVREVHYRRRRSHDPDPAPGRPTACP